MKGFAVEVTEGITRIALEYRQTTRSEIPATAHFIRFPEVEGMRPEVIAIDPSRMGESKEEMALGIRMMVSMLGAEYVILVTEAYSSEGSSEEDRIALNAWTESGRSLKDFPGRQEILMVSLDGPDTSIMFSAPINDDGSVGTPQRYEGLEMGGRLANLSHPGAVEGSEMWN